MMKLMKYELKKRKPFIIGVISLLVAAEMLAIYNLYARGGDTAPFSAVLSGAMLIGVFAYTWLSVVVDYYGEFTGKQRLLLMSIPLSSRKITGAKYLYAFFENLAILAITCGLVALTNYLWYLQSGTNFIGIMYSKVIEMFGEAPVDITQFNITTISILAVITVLVQYIFSIVTATLAITISTTVISGSKLNWLISILLYWVISFVLKMVLIVPAFITDSMQLIDSVNEVYVSLGITVGGYLIFIIAEFIIQNILITKKLDV